MARLNVFITGVSGSVGHYVYDLLQNNPKYQLYLLLRDRKKLKRNLAKANNVTVLEGDMQHVHLHKDLLKQMDYLIHIATNWGGYREPWQINVLATARMFRALDPQRIKKVVYFSTASILDRDHKPVEKIREIGTNYIRSKFLMHKVLPKFKIYNKIMTVFPTWVFGGGKEYPYSHAASGLVGLKNSIKFLKFFKLDFLFHYIHCADIASVVNYMLEHDLPFKEYVLGNPALSVGGFLKSAAEYFGEKYYFQLPIPVRLVQLAAKLKRGHPWDNYCLQYRHFTYNAVNCRTFGLESKTANVAGLLGSFNL